MDSLRGENFAFHEIDGTLLGKHFSSYLGSDGCKMHEEI